MVQFLPISPELDKAQNYQQTNPASVQRGTVSLNTRPYSPLPPAPRSRPPALHLLIRGSVILNETNGREYSWTVISLAEVASANFR